MRLKLKRPVDMRDEFAHQRAQLQIDKNSLDDECMRQPVLYQELSEAHVNAVAERDTAKENVAVVDARLAEEYRTNATEKLTDKKTADLVSLDDRHRRAFTEWQEAAKKAAYLNTLVTAAEQRGKMLQELAKLYVAGYFDRVVAGNSRKNNDAAMAAAGREGMRRLRNRETE